MQAVGRTVFKVFIGCCSSSFLMEILMARAPESANLITFLQFFFISLQASMLVSWYAFKRPPKTTRAVGSILISIGVALAMYGGATIEQNRGRFLYWCVGVAILLSTLITGAFTGLQQELLYSKYGKHPDEMLFYTNAIPLPLFLALYPQLHSTAYSLPINTWLLIAMNIISQFYCTHSVHKLATRESSVTVTFILTLRKFVSLLLSSVVFKNNLTVFHVVGTLLVGADRLRRSRDRDRRTDGDRRRTDGDRRGDGERPRENDRRRGLRLRDLTHTS
ncbi:hypothetical protein MSG28_000112, partial [Choristoneura fumiferana]